MPTETYGIVEPNIDGLFSVGILLNSVKFLYKADFWYQLLSDIAQISSSGLIWPSLF